MGQFGVKEMTNDQTPMTNDGILCLVAKSFVTCILWIAHEDISEKVRLTGLLFQPTTVERLLWTRSLQMN